MTKKKQKELEKKMEKAIAQYEAFDYDRGEIENFYWNELCPRCGNESKILCGAPYCLHCNWDSLHDPTYEMNE